MFAAFPSGFYAPQLQQLCPPFLPLLQLQPQNWMFSGFPESPRFEMQTTAPHSVSTLISAAEFAAMPQTPPPNSEDHKSVPTIKVSVESPQSGRIDSIGSTESRAARPAAQRPPSRSSKPPRRTAVKSSSERNQNTKTYPCPICDRVFSNSSNRARHKRVHTGEKPYSCCHCGLTFANASNRKKHQQTCGAPFPSKLGREQSAGEIQDFVGRSYDLTTGVPGRLVLAPTVRPQGLMDPDGGRRNLPQGGDDDISLEISDVFVEHPVGVLCRSIGTQPDNA
eukprot:m.30210 g.30210  ORF g.30210 m.30210 type:complete len:280 (+) comp6767_c0_seq1:327-1166(+)